MAEEPQATNQEPKIIELKSSDQPSENPPSDFDDLTALAHNFTVMTAKPAQTSKSPIWIVSSGIIVLVLIIILSRYFGRKPPPRQYDAPIPYVWNTNFAKTLNIYLNQPEHREILVVTGPKGFGKTRGLLTKSREITSNDGLVFNFDFLRLSRSAKSNDLIFYLQNIVEKSLAAFDGHAVSKSAVSLITALASVSSPIQNFTSTIKDVQLRRISNSLKTILSQYNSNPKLALHTFFESISHLSPVVIINDLDTFCNASHFWTALGTVSIPVIIEVSESSSIPLDNTRTLRVDDFDIESGRSLFVKRDKVFSANDYTAIYDKVGGCGQCFATIHELQREGISLNEAIQSLLNEAKGFLLREPPATRDILRGKNLGKLPPADVERLMKLGIITKNNDQLSLASKLYKLAADVT